MPAQTSSRAHRALAALTEVAQAVNQSLDPAEVERAAVEAVTSAMRVDGAILRTLDLATGALAIGAAHGVGDAFVDELRVLDFGQGLAGEVVLTNQPLVVEDARRDPRLPWAAARRELIRSVAIVPIHARSRLVGTLATFTRERRRYRADDLELLQTIADQVGVALENATLYAAERERVTSLQRLTRLQDEFVATVSHELRTPMTIVKATIDALDSRWDELVDERRREYVRIGRDGSDRLKQLLENLLLCAQIEDHRLQLRIASVEPAHVVREALGEVRRRHAVELAFSVALGTPTCRADPERLCEVLVQLVDNALRYGGPPVSVDVSYDGDRVRFDVRDAGTGIPADDLGRLFKRFERVDRSVRSHGGTGLGLYISRRLVEAMGGDVHATSETGRGSTFSVRLPIHRGAD